MLALHRTHRSFVAAPLLPMPTDARSTGWGRSRSGGWSSSWSRRSRPSVVPRLPPSPRVRVGARVVGRSRDWLTSAATCSSTRRSVSRSRSGTGGSRRSWVPAPPWRPPWRSPRSRSRVATRASRTSWWTRWPWRPGRCVARQASASQMERGWNALLAGAVGAARAPAARRRAPARGLQRPLLPGVDARAAPDVQLPGRVVAARIGEVPLPAAGRVPDWGPPGAARARRAARSSRGPRPRARRARADSEDQWSGVVRAPPSRR